MKKGQQKKVTKIRTKPSRKQAEEAVKTLIQWAGDNPDREGLLETPKRVVNAYKEFFGGYESDPEQVLSKTLLLLNLIVNIIWFLSLVLLILDISLINV